MISSFKIHFQSSVHIGNMGKTEFIQIVMQMHTSLVFLLGGCN